MITLKIGNSESSISGLNAPQLKELRHLLSYTLSPQASFHSGAFAAQRKHLMDKVGRFPTGLLYLVRSYLKSHHLTNMTITDTRVVPASSPDMFNLKLTIRPYDEQLEAALACHTHSRGIISMPTGTGKSLVIALIINQLQVPTLVVVPSLELKKQLKQSLKEAFGSLKNITVENVDSVPTTNPGYHCVIIDEFHHSAATTYRRLNKKTWNNVYYKVGMTATPFRSQDTERLLLESVLSKVIYRLDYHTAVAKGYIVPVEAYYYEIPKTQIKGNPKSWPSMYSELVVNNTPRNALIADILGSLCSAGVSTLCLVKEVKHGEDLVERTGLPFAKGENDNNRELILEFNLEEKRVLIGTTGVLGEGIDTKPCEYVVIAGLGKSKNQFMQQVGRAVRKYPGKESAKVIIFLDRSHKWCIAHFREQCKILLDEYGVKPIKIN